MHEFNMRSELMKRVNSRQLAKMISAKDNGNKTDTDSRFPKCNGYVCLFDCESQFGSFSEKDSMRDSVKVSFDYEIYVNLSTSLPAALQALEENILKYVSKELHLDDCDLQKQLSDKSDGLITSLASSPKDEVDRNNVNCIVQIDQKPENTVCIPIQGFMSADYRGILRKQAINRVYQILDQGMTDGLFVTENIHKLSFVGSRPVNLGGANRSGKVLLESKSSKSLSIMAASGVIFVALFLGFASTFFVAKRRRQKENENEENEEYDHQSLSTIKFDKELGLDGENKCEAYDMNEINDDFYVNPESEGDSEFTKPANSLLMLSPTAVSRPGTPTYAEDQANQFSSKTISKFKRKKKSKSEKDQLMGNKNNLSVIMEGSRESSTQTSNPSNSRSSQDIGPFTGSLELSKVGSFSSSKSGRSNLSRSYCSAYESDSYTSSSFHNESSPNRNNFRPPNDIEIQESSFQSENLSIGRILYEISEDTSIT